jgi:branched-chain amino acid transport system permease protein
MSKYKILFFLTLVIASVAIPPFLSINAQNLLVKILIAVLFATSFNLLAGQAGMLSFGHAAYYGIGSFAVLHLMQYLECSGLAFPTPLLPLAGAIIGLVFGLFAGFFSTIRTGVYFSLVTLALAEMLHALAPHWEGVFGGEAGLSSMRLPWAGFTFGSILEVYFLILVWVSVSISLMYAYTRTPLGRLTLALRDNEQRVRFMGYDAHKTKVVIFALSAMFSGIAGGLLAISNEIANYTMFGTDVSAQVVLYTYVGGASFFFGPIVGATIFSVFSFIVSDMTKSWALYQGVIFVLVMLFAPSGIAGLFNIHIVHFKKIRWKKLLLPYFSAIISAFLVMIGFVFTIETAALLLSDSYRVLRENLGTSYPPYELFGFTWQLNSISMWAVLVISYSAGFALLPYAKKNIRGEWQKYLVGRNEAGFVNSEAEEVR